MQASPNYDNNQSNKGGKMNKNRLTRAELIKITGVQFHRIDYLRMTGKLPIVKKSSGQGRPTYFHPSAVDVIKSYYEDSPEDETIESNLGDKETEKYLTIKDVADFTSLSPITIHRYVQKGELKCSRKTGKTLFRKKDVKNWLDS